MARRSRRHRPVAGAKRPSTPDTSAGTGVAGDTNRGASTDKGVGGAKSAGNGKRRIPRPVAAVSILLAIAAVASMAAALEQGFALAGADDPDARTARQVLVGFLACFGLANAALFIFLRRARSWARAATVSLYMVAALVEGMRVLSDGANGSSWLTIAVGAVIIVLLLRPESSQRFFAD